MDLKAQNSFIKWATEQGYSVFAVSWVNLDASYSDVGLEEFILERFISAPEIAKEISGQPQINVIGYCIGGTLLALVLALLKKRGNTSIKTINFFSTLNNFPNNLNLRFFYKMFCWPN